MQHILFYDWTHHSKQFKLGGAKKPREEEGELVTKLVNQNGVFRAAPLALPRSTNYLQLFTTSLLKIKNISVSKYIGLQVPHYRKHS